ncbi:MAG TPA: response regulator transcription factor [Candidatus Acidoferrum sp.]|nr:response regulator transcription factor [Candidatus Acidoferrum sp.]
MADGSPVMLRALQGVLATDDRFDVVGTASSGHEAILTAASLKPQLVLVDLHLPHLDGPQVTRCLKQFEKPPVVFMVTSDDSIASRATSSAVGADAFILKSPDLPRQLKSKLQESFGPNHRPRVGSGAKASRTSTTPVTPTSVPSG